MHPTTAPRDKSSSQSELHEISQFDSLTQTWPRRWRGSWQTLARRLTRYVERPTKGGSLWSPVRYQPGTRRGNDNVAAVTLLVAEFDHSEPDWPLIADLDYVAYTTWSHTHDDPHWRVVVRLAEEVPASEWPEVWQRAAFWLFPGLDPACKDPARLYYWPTCRPRAQTEVRHGGA